MRCSSSRSRVLSCSTAAASCAPITSARCPRCPLAAAVAGVALVDRRAVAVAAAAPDGAACCGEALGCPRYAGCGSATGGSGGGGGGGGGVAAAATVVATPAAAAAAASNSGEPRTRSSLSQRGASSAKPLRVTRQMVSASSCGESSCTSSVTQGSSVCCTSAAVARWGTTRISARHACSCMSVMNSYGDTGAAAAAAATASLPLSGVAGRGRGRPAHDAARPVAHLARALAVRRACGSDGCGGRGGGGEGGRRRVRRGAQGGRVGLDGLRLGEALEPHVDAHGLLWVECDLRERLEHVQRQRQLHGGVHQGGTREAVDVQDVEVELDA
eukprot:Rhum_TRINITY_DN14982_c9_g2::Rhum_TRINITY_DN14982_c9_g2_i1::g.131277::m.131277